ncbi:ribonuclease III [Salinibacter altiplanensis]|uniref:ribonuclease III n=1 Tax=Salinibacter altiplanensis TaxID=1803181 RepID=UPI000C9F9AA4|nr:ribonuclease III [Salinibacter altiplanensis]
MSTSLPSGVQVDPSAVEDLVGRPIDDRSHYRRAFTHRSLLRVHPDYTFQSNERLEFLGDALLDVFVGEVLYERFPEKDEGALTRLRARLVSETPLALYARRLDLGRHLLMSQNAAQEDGRDNPSILADAFEALVGAIYLDLGYEAAQAFVRNRVLAPLDLRAVATQDENYKSQLLESLQAQGRPQPTYHVVRESGPSHDKTFTVEVRVDDTAYEHGTAGSKQEAEQQAARRTLDELTTDPPAS